VPFYVSSVQLSTAPVGDPPWVEVSQVGPIQELPVAQFQERVGPLDYPAAVPEELAELSEREPKFDWFVVVLSSR
jgi:hypothetical protein